MALSATTIFYNDTGGSDSANGGAFDPGQTAGMFADGAATSATGNSPVFSSASYNFAAGDVGHWVYIASGTNWTPGWYQIASVASNVATLTASVGNAVLVGHRPSTVAGCATVASPTGATWSIDYSRSTTARIAFTDLASAGAGLTASSAGNPIGKQMVGNAILIASGTNFTAGLYVLVSVAAGVGTFVGAGNMTSGVGSGGTGGMGGAFATPGKAASFQVGGNDFLIKAGTYACTSISTNVAGGMLSPVAGTSTDSTRFVGFQTIPGDNGTHPLLQASGAISAFTMFTVAAGVRVENIDFDCASKTTSRAVGGAAASVFVRCKFLNCTNSAVSGVNTMQFLFCEATGCATSAAFITGSYFYCSAYSNTVTAFAPAASTMIGCVAANNSGASSDGFAGSASNVYIGCVAYNNGRSGFLWTNSAVACQAINCIAVNNAAYGFNVSAASNLMYFYNCAGYNNTTANFNTTNISAFNMVGTITLPGDPFTNAAGNDFSLNSTAGAALRAAGIPGSSGSYKLPGLSTNSYFDVGASQHADPASLTAPLARII